MPSASLKSKKATKEARFYDSSSPAKTRCVKLKFAEFHVANVKSSTLQQYAFIVLSAGVT